MIWPFLFHALRGVHRSFEIKGIDFVEDGGRLWRHSELGGSRRNNNRRQEEQTNRTGATSYPQYIHCPPPEKEIAQVQPLRRMSLSCSRRVRNGFCRMNLG
jgi:hypothetical protein